MAENRPFDHLKRHVPTNLALLATIASAAMPVLSATFLATPHGFTAARSHPLYWLLMAPLAVWAWGAISFDAWAMRLIGPVLVGAPMAAALVAGLSKATGGDATALWALAAGSLAASAAGAWALGRSPLWPFTKP